MPNRTRFQIALTGGIPGERGSDQRWRHVPQLK